MTRKAARQLKSGKPATVESSYWDYRDRLSVRESAYAVARKWGLTIEAVCSRLDLTVQYIKDRRRK